MWAFSRSKLEGIRGNRLLSGDFHLESTISLFKAAYLNHIQPSNLKEVTLCSFIFLPIHGRFYCSGLLKVLGESRVKHGSLYQTDFLFLAEVYHSDPFQCRPRHNIVIAHNIGDWAFLVVVEYDLLVHFDEAPGVVKEFARPCPQKELNVVIVELRVPQSEAFQLMFLRVNCLILEFNTHRGDFEHAII